MVELIRGLDSARIKANLERVREVAGADVEVLAATKYVAPGEMGALKEAGIVLVGENRLQDLELKQAAGGNDFTWDFIGKLQSRKVREIVPRVRLIHSVESDSVLTQLGRHGHADTEVLVQVNAADEDAKAGVAPRELAAFIERCPVSVVGLSTMPPLAADAEDSRPYFARLAELAAEHGLARLSMGTSQDWPVAVQEGATTIRLGSSLYI